ncbi:family 18 glycoside hydrolase, partial [Fistulina hepatica ATCC 64428]
PNRQNIGCDTINVGDTAHLLSFLQDLKSAYSNISISLPTSLLPYNDASSSPSVNLSVFADVVTYIAIMNYDVWTPYHTTHVGPNAPL